MRNVGFRPSIQVRIVMLISAYTPLMILLAALGTWPCWWMRSGMIVTAVISMLFLSLFFRQLRRRNHQPLVIYQIKPREGEALKFFASYVIPFFIATTAQPNARWGLLVYFLILATLYVRGDLYFANPVIALFGYRVFELTTEDRGFRIVISRQWYLTPRTTLSLVSLGGYVYFDCWTPKQGHN